MDIEHARKRFNALWDGWNIKTIGLALCDEVERLQKERDQLVATIQHALAHAVMEEENEL